MSCNLDTLDHVHAVVNTHMYTHAHAVSDDTGTVTDEEVLRLWSEHYNSYYWYCYQIYRQEHFAAGEKEVETEMQETEELESETTSEDGGDGLCVENSGSLHQLGGDSELTQMHAEFGEQAGGVNTVVELNRNELPLGVSDEESCANFQQPEGEVDSEVLSPVPVHEQRENRRQDGAECSSQKQDAL